MNASTTLKEVQKIELEQGCQEWHALRKTKITATDAAVIMGSSPWKTRTQLYKEKISNDPPMSPNSRMQRGTALEPRARDLFNIKTGFNMKPAILVKDWAMASLDGLDENIFGVLEVKCPGAIDHERALNGMIPDHYYPQLQHQMYVADVQLVHYFSFDGIDGVIVKAKRNDDYIEKMIIEEKKFYECLMNKIPPEPSESEYVERNDWQWEQCASKWKSVTNSIKELEKEQEELRKQLILLSGDSNTKGAGLSLCQVQRIGNVDYSKIPQLKGINLDQFRKGSSSSWRITCA